MKEMVNAFSDYARTPMMKFQELQLNQLIEEVVDLYHHTSTPLEDILDLYEHPPSQFELNLAENLPIIQADKGRLRQVLHNLVKNALEASPPRSTIILTTQLLNYANLNQVELRVQDQGAGIPVEKLGSVFEPYVTTKAKGTGLGLAIVKKIIDEHGGSVWIENHGGACVVMRLPVLGGGEAG
jgi:nitrogen fixation/metabolism regulation signal transduction histidine kinase